MLISMNIFFGQSIVYQINLFLNKIDYIVPTTHQDIVGLEVSMDNALFVYIF